MKNYSLKVEYKLKMRGPRANFLRLERTRMRGGSLMLLPIERQKVKGIGPSALEEKVRDREQEPTGASDGPAIATSFGHDIDTGLQELKGLNRRDMRA